MVNCRNAIRDYYLAETTGHQQAFKRDYDGQTGVQVKCECHSSWWQKKKPHYKKISLVSTRLQSAFITYPKKRPLIRRFGIHGTSSHSCLEVSRKKLIYLPPPIIFKSISSSLLSSHMILILYILICKPSLSCLYYWKASVRVIILFYSPVRISNYLINKV